MRPDRRGAPVWRKREERRTAKRARGQAACRAVWKCGRRMSQRRGGGRPSQVRTQRATDKSSHAGTHRIAERESALCFRAGCLSPERVQLLRVPCPRRPWRHRGGKESLFYDARPRRPWRRRSHPAFPGSGRREIHRNGPRADSVCRTRAPFAHDHPHASVWASESGGASLLFRRGRCESSTGSSAGKGNRQNHQQWSQARWQQSIRLHQLPQLGQ